MLVFKMEMRVTADKWNTEDEKQVFMKNAEKVVNDGLNRMTVPDWKVTITDVKEEGE